MAKVEKLGYYEKRLCMLLFLSSIPNAFTTFQILILQFIPSHRCNVFNQVGNQISLFKNISGSQNLTLEEALNFTIPWERGNNGKMSRSKCFQYDSRLNYSRENRTTLPCESMYYEGIEVSAVTEFNLVCDRAWMRPVFGCVMFVGMMLGSLVSGYLADRFGRRPVFLIFTAWQFITVFLLSFAPNVWSYVTLYLLCGIGNLVNYNIASVIGTEMTTKKYRLWMYFVLLMGFSVGYVLMSPLIYWFRDWRWFLRFNGLIGLLYIPYYWLIDETPRWLLATGRLNEAKQICQKIAKLNNSYGETSEFLHEAEVQKSFSVMQTIVKIGKEPILLFRLAISTFMWFILGLMYFCLAFGTNNLSGNRFLNIFLSSFTELSGALLFLVCERKMGRVNTYILPTTLFGLSMIVTCLVPESQVAVLISLNLFGKLMVSSSYAIVYVQIMEIFPTKARQTVIFIVVLASRIGGVLSPIMIYVDEEDINLIPYLVAAILVLLSAFACAFLPETKGIPLPQTVDEAKAMPRKQWCNSGQTDRKATPEVTHELQTSLVNIKELDI